MQIPPQKICETDTTLSSIISSLYISLTKYPHNYLSSKESTLLEGDGDFQPGPATVYYHILNPHSILSSNCHNSHPYHPKLDTNFIQTNTKCTLISLSTPYDLLLLIQSNVHHLQKVTQIFHLDKRSSIVVNLSDV